jgi:hypothetical protein
MNDFEKFLCFLVGVDEVHIKGGTVVCKFLKESSRYTVYAEAIAFIEEYNLCTTGDRKFLLAVIRNTIKLSFRYEKLSFFAPFFSV